MPFTFTVQCGDEEHELEVDSNAQIHIKAHDPKLLEMMKAFQAFGATGGEGCLRAIELWDHVQYQFEKPPKARHIGERGNWKIDPQWEGSEIFDDEELDEEMFVSMLVDIFALTLDDEMRDRAPFSAPRIAELIEMISPGTLYVDSSSLENEGQTGKLFVLYTFYIKASDDTSSYRGSWDREVGEWERAIERSIHDVATFKSESMDLCEAADSYCTPDVVREVLAVLDEEDADKDLDEPDEPYHPDAGEWDPDSPDEHALLYESDQWDEPRITFFWSASAANEAMEFSKTLLRDWGYNVEITPLRLKDEDELAEEAREKQEALEDALYRQTQGHLFGEPPPTIPEEPELSELEKILALYEED
jgi:hypothetical protein